MSSRVGLVYYCSICGSEVKFEHDGGGPLKCCDQVMELKKEE